VFYGTSTQDRSICANLPGGITGSAFEDSQGGTYKQTVACDTMNIQMQRQTTGMPYLLKDKQCIQQITRPRMGKKRKPACDADKRVWLICDTHTDGDKYITMASPCSPTIGMQLSERALHARRQP